MSDAEQIPHPSNLTFLESLYADYLVNPDLVPPDWKPYFQKLTSEVGSAVRFHRGPTFSRRSIFHGSAVGTSNGKAADGETTIAALQDRVDQLIRAYRARGHMIADLDPLGLPGPRPPELDPNFFGLSEADMDRSFSTNSIHGSEVLTLREILERLRNTYCRSIGVQFMHIDDLSVRKWLQERMEGTENRLRLTQEEQVRILTWLTDAVIFESFIQKKYTGAKRFSLEGAESLIPLLALAVEEAGEQGLEEIVFGMAHRGRINVLANILKKSPTVIFREFEDAEPELYLGGGDVKYHLGHSTDWVTASGRTIHLSLCFNPSHLEFVNPVALGRVRAKQDRMGDRRRERGMTILIHGDAAFVGQGVVQESLNLSRLEGFTTGGTLHIIVNNQLGFTTSPAEGRSSVYATDVARMLQSPIFHVNGEDPEAVAQVVKLSMDFRRQFRRDVVIDMYCYRRQGHNEGDEPAFTQPLMYAAIEKRKSVREGYLDHLLQIEDLTREEADRIAEERRANLETQLSVARGDEPVNRLEMLGGVWSGYRGGPENPVEVVETAVEKGRLASLLKAQTVLPEDFRPHPKIERWLQTREEMAGGKRPLDWAAAESLAFATLAVEGVRVRFSGQDTARGTFSHRHTVLHDVRDGHTYIPLYHLSEDQVPVEIYNSPLSEIGVLGFEYGYSLDCPDGLILWEAQFGDFSNAAQVIIDQFISSAEDKWSRLSGLVMLLPHGFEGQGPEHSSARLERYLVLAAEDNLRIVNLTTPAQYFHCLRRQVVSPWRKPLVAMSPKSLLRHPEAVSTLDDLASGGFRRLIPDAGEKPDSIQRIFLCSGKIYYDLARKRREAGRSDVAILRLEQLYPLPNGVLEEALSVYPDGTPVVWVQEEPENMGAWRYVRYRLGERALGRFPLSGVYRAASASPATGSAASHKLEQEQLLERAFGEAVLS